MKKEIMSKMAELAYLLAGAYVKTGEVKYKVIADIIIKLMKCI